MKNLLEVIDLYDDDTPGMADGGRIGFKDSKMPIKQALKEIVEEKGTNFKSQQQLSDLVEEKVGYKPNSKVLRPSKYSILEGVTYDSTANPFTDKQLKDILGDDLRKFRAQNLSDSEIRKRASSRKQYQNLFKRIYSEINEDNVHSISLGPLRFPKGYFNKIFGYHRKEEIFSYLNINSRNTVSYDVALENEMNSFCKNELLKYSSKKKVFNCFS